MRSATMGFAVLAVTCVLFAAVVIAQQAPMPARDTLPDGPRIFDSSRRGPSGRPIPGPQFRVVPMKGLSHPYALVFLPDGNMLITERAGRIRIVRNGVLNPTPIAGMPAIANRNLQGLNDIALHPRFAENQWVYFTYYREKAGDQEAATARFTWPSAFRLSTAGAEDWRRCRMHRIRPATSARSCVSTTTGAFHQIIRSLGAPATNPNCMRLAFGTRWGSLFIPSPAKSGKTRMV